MEAKGYRAIADDLLGHGESVDASSPQPRRPAAGISTTELSVAVALIRYRAHTHGSKQ